MSTGKVYLLYEEQESPFSSDEHPDDVVIGVFDKFEEAMKHVLSPDKYRWVDIWEMNNFAN